MKADLYIKAVLTAIALLLAVIAWRMPPTPVHAQNSYSMLQFDQAIRRINVPGGQASVDGRVAIDLRTGNIYGFPTQGQPYPITLQDDQPPVSKPVLLGTFDLSGIK